MTGRQFEEIKVLCLWDRSRGAASLHTRLWSGWHFKTDAQVVQTKACSGNKAGFKDTNMTVCPIICQTFSHISSQGCHTYHLQCVSEIQLFPGLLMAEHNPQTKTILWWNHSHIVLFLYIKIFFKFSKRNIRYILH